MDNRPYFLVKVHQVQMMRDRGFPIEPDEQEYLLYDDTWPLDYGPAKQALQKFNEKIAGRVPEQVMQKDYLDETRYVSVHYVTYGKFTERGKVTHNIDDIITKTGGEISKISREFRLIMISPEALPSSKNNIFIDYPALNIQFFQFYELKFNITKHFLVPRHELLTEEEKAKLLKVVRASELPIIDIADPVAKYFGAKTDDIFRITRRDISIDTISQGSVIYRIVLRQSV